MKQKEQFDNLPNISVSHRRVYNISPLDVTVLALLIKYVCWLSD